MDINRSFDKFNDKNDSLVKNFERRINILQEELALERSKKN